MKKLLSILLTLAMLMTLVSMAKFSVAATSVSLFWPANSRTINSYYGSRPDFGDFHLGIDIAGSIGDPIYAAADGTVVKKGWGDSYGNQIILYHPSLGIYTNYAHASQLLVEVGQSVSAGQKIGLIGATGNVTGPHLHFETRTANSSNNTYNPLDNSFYYDLGNSPVGVMDFMEPGEGCVRVHGWAFDTDDLSKIVAIHVYIGDEGHAFVASESRPDVDSVYHCGNNHGYDEVVQTNKTGTQTITVYAINEVGTGGNVVIGQSSIFINPAYPPESDVNHCRGVEGGIEIRGWSFDRTELSWNVNIKVCIGEEEHSIVADDLRQDVNDYYGIGGEHGFDNTVLTNKTGKQTVKIYAENVKCMLLWSSVPEYTLIGTYEVTIPSSTDPSVTEPTETNPTETEPTSTDPSTTEPTETEPTETNPTETDPSSTDPSAPAASLLGDTNNDGDVNMKDVLALRKFLAGMDVSINITNSDTNEDTFVNMKDVLLIRKFLAGLIDKLGA